MDGGPSGVQRTSELLHRVDDHNTGGLGRQGRQGRRRRERRQRWWQRRLQRRWQGRQPRLPIYEERAEQVVVAATAEARTLSSEAPVRYRRYKKIRSWRSWHGCDARAHDSYEKDTLDPGQYLVGSNATLQLLALT